MSLSLALLITFIVITLIYIVYSEYKTKEDKSKFMTESVYDNLLEDDEEFPMPKAKGRMILEDFQGVFKDDNTDVF